MLAMTKCSVAKTFLKAYSAFSNASDLPFDHRHPRSRCFNLFSEEDTYLFRTLLQGEFFISGFTNKQLRRYFPNKSAIQITRLLNRLRAHGVIKKVGNRYKYYLTEFGRQAAAMALKLREMVVIPELAHAANAQP